MHHHLHSLRRLLCHWSYYYQLIFYQERVHQMEVHYNPKRFKSFDRNDPRFRVQKPPAIKLLTAIYLLFGLRSLIIVTVRPATATRFRRVLIGAEHWARAGNETSASASASASGNATTSARTILETTFLFWCTICVLFLTVTLSSCLLDYKWMALFTMRSEKELKGNGNNKGGGGFLTPKDVGLTQAEYQRFSRFRSALVAYFGYIMATVAPAGWVTIIALHYPLYRSDPCWAVLSSSVIIYWMYICTSSIYNFFLSFILLLRYTVIKHQSRWRQLQLAYASLLGQFSETKNEKGKNLVSSNSQKSNLLGLLGQHFLRISQLTSAARSYTAVYSELADYNSFGASYLTYLFVLYIALVAFSVYVVLFVHLTWHLNLTYVLVSGNHILNMVVIIYFSGVLVTRNGRLSAKVSSATCRLMTQLGHQYTMVSQLKFHTINESISLLSWSGFRLSNGYLITHSTFQIIIVNVVIYFLLVLGNVLY